VIHDERQRLVRLAKIGRGEHADDAGHLSGCRCIDGVDARVAMRASQNRGVKAAEGPNIGGVLTLAL
jgi:hypothetical protein